MTEYENGWKSLELIGKQSRLVGNEIAVNQDVGCAKLFMTCPLNL